MIAKSRTITFWIVLVVALAMLSAACGGQQPAGPATTSESEEQVETQPVQETEAEAEAPAASEKEGGTLVIAMHDEPPNLDPHKTEAWYAWAIELQMYDTLVVAETQEGAVEYKPGLATSWESSEDGLTWTFELRDDVMFHDGTPFNAEAVAFSIDRILDPETKSPTAAPLLGGNVESAEAVDEYTVQINLNTPFAGFLSSLSDIVLAPVSPTAVEALGEEFGQQPAGTGPFMFKEWVTGDHITLVRNPDYNWGPEAAYERPGPAYLDEIVIRIVPEATVRSAMLEQGEANVVTNVNPVDVTRFEEDPNFQIIGGWRPGTPSINWFNTEKPPTDDIRVRQAVLHALDWEEVNRLVYHGSYAVADTVLSPSSLGYNPAYDFRAAYPYDPEKAEQLLEEAGWVDSDGDGIREKDGQDLELVYICFPGNHCKEGEVQQGQLKEVGVFLRIREMGQPANVNATQQGEHNFRSIGWGGLDSGQLLSYMLHSDNIGDGWNFTRYRDPELDELLNKASSELDPAQQAEYVKQVQQIVVDQALGEPKYYYRRLHGASGALTGYNYEARGLPWYKDAYFEK